MESETLPRTNMQEAERLEQQRLAEAALEIARAFMGQHYPSLPAQHDDFRKSVLLPGMKEIWSTLEELETSCAEGSFPKGFAHELLWPRSVIVREIFTGAWEMDFENIPAEYMTRIRALFCNFRGSRIVEQGFNHLTDEFKHTSSANLKRLHRWSSLVTSPLLRDHGHEGVRPTEDKSEVQEADVSEPKFCCNESDFSLGSGAAKAIEQDSSGNASIVVVLSCRLLGGWVEETCVHIATPYGVITLLLTLKKQKGKHFLNYVSGDGGPA
eukprot:5154491-Amphidinium_carterae.4